MTGLHVVLSGPDGSGKTALTTSVCRLLESRALRVETAHLWNQTTNKARNRLGVAPYRLPPRSFFGSFLKAILMVGRYQRLFWLCIRPHKKSGGIFWSDRHFIDFVADPQRFRVRLPDFIRWSLWRFVPSADLTIILMTNVETLQCRTGEIGFEQSQNQIDAYERVLWRESDFIRIDASQSIDQSSAQLERLIIDQLGLSVH